MKQYFKILSFLSLLFLLTSEDCSNRDLPMSSEEKSSTLYQNLEDEFLIEELNTTKLLAFEKRAVQKLSDLSDYLTIYADSSLSNEFRIQAKNTLRDMFYSEEDLQNYFNAFSFVEDSSENQLYFGFNNDVVNTSIDSIQMVESFVKKGSKYEGSIQFSQVLYPFGNSTNQIIHFYDQQIKIIVIKSEKHFGDKALDIWTVYLGG